MMSLLRSLKSFLISDAYKYAAPMVLCGEPRCPDWFARPPSPKSSPPGEDFTGHAFWFANDSHANPAVRISKNAANDSPSPGGAATAAMAGEDGRSN